VSVIQYIYGGLTSHSYGKREEGTWLSKAKGS